MSLTELTTVTGPGIHTLSNITSHNINSSGIITATAFSGDGSNLSGVTQSDTPLATNIIAESFEAVVLANLTKLAPVNE